LLLILISQYFLQFTNFHIFNSSIFTYFVKIHRSPFFSTFYVISNSLVFANVSSVYTVYKLHIDLGTNQQWWYPSEESGRYCRGLWLHSAAVTHTSRVGEVHTKLLWTTSRWSGKNWYILDYHGSLLQVFFNIIIVRPKNLGTNVYRAQSHIIMYCTVFIYNFFVLSLLFYFSVPIVGCPQFLHCLENFKIFLNFFFFIDI